jgi:hypothetical protein
VRKFLVAVAFVIGVSSGAAAQDTELQRLAEGAKFAHECMRDARKIGGTGAERLESISNCMEGADGALGDDHKSELTKAGMWIEADTIIRNGDLGKIPRNESTASEFISIDYIHENGEILFNYATKNGLTAKIICVALDIDKCNGFPKYDKR